MQINSRVNDDNIATPFESQYNETAKAKRNAKYLAMLDKSMEEATAGSLVIKSVEELENCE